MKLALAFLILLFSLNSCSDKKVDEFVLPASTHLSSTVFFDPILTEYLLEPPLKYGVLWNRELLSQSKIFRIKLTSFGMLSPTSPSEEIEYLFDRKGKFEKYSYFNFKFSDSVYSEIVGDYFNGELISFKSPLFFGKVQNSKVKVRNLKDQIQYISINENAMNDTTFIFLKNKKPLVIAEKLGKYVSKIQFVCENNCSDSQINSWIRILGISKENWINTDKIIIQTENSLPQKAYRINADLKKSEIYAEWTYDNSEKLIAYKKYLKGNCVLDFTFDYSKDKVMRSFRLNRKRYEIQYN